MKYNHGLAKKKFEYEWKQREKQYRELGMTDEQISSIREFDELDHSQKSRQRIRKSKKSFRIG